MLKIGMLRLLNKNYNLRISALSRNPAFYERTKNEFQ